MFTIGDFSGSASHNTSKPDGSMTFGTRLRKHRQKKRFSQKEVAEYLGVSQTTYCNWEMDVSSYPVKHLPQLAQLFDVSVVELIPERINAIPMNGYTEVNGIADTVKMDGIDLIYTDLLTSKEEIIKLLKEENKRLKRHYDQL